MKFNRKDSNGLLILCDLNAILVGKHFQQSSELKKHATVHTGEKQFECDICEQKFRLKQQMKKHKKIHAK